ncbi:uncharacterized protein [Centruroides vittatus]|uniref:uncharacterized protein n=1 Tax=Centruroides vittatus TaxID=120091 RepID=UPI00350FD65C
MNYHHASGSEKRKCEEVGGKIDNINVEVEPEEKDVGEYSGNSENQEVQIEKTENNENIIEVVEMKNIEAKNIPEVEKKNENAINEVEIQNIEGRSNIVNDILVFDNLDISLWPLNLTTDTQHYLLKNKPSSNISLVHTAKKVVTEGGKTVTRTLKKNIFTRNKANGEKIEREWLVCSPRSKAIYCYVCKIFAIRRTAFTEGFSDWKNVNVRVKKHERSTDHRHSIEILIGRNSVEGRVDTIVEKKYLEKKILEKSTAAGSSNNKIFS